ncbi:MULTISPECIES: SDR family oxidoreductase [unclassified Chelatococcus]|uniref:SDR family oxidoreductase n=1 Tax=unclassified Chelatococcus TaxID=2638111 RepID=UPI001BCF0599|nr:MULTISPECIES: SDR family oxidoreductase [unclassified Chelatococcus]MBS7743473.1 SDR family oxidoreductase [Chelatococcus sp. HY11]MBX3547087.1 SDR family oxidoreductase [Chelatococcus sp.]
MSLNFSPASLFETKDKIVLVTGGAQGLGRMIAEGFVLGGAKVYITSRKEEVVTAAEAELRRSGECVGIVADLSSPEACSALAQRIRESETRLDVLINNAGRTWGAPLETFPDKAWASVMAVNVQGPFTLVRDLLPLLKREERGADPARIINIGSLAGLRAEPLSAFSYASSKAAVHHLSRVLAAELAPYGITVNTLIPGYFPTQMTAHIRGEEEKLSELVERVPLGRMGTAEDVVGASIMLASRAGAYMTGTEIILDGGMFGCR